MADFISNKYALRISVFILIILIGTFPTLSLSTECPCSPDGINFYTYSYSYDSLSGRKGGGAVVKSKENPCLYTIDRNSPNPDSSSYTLSIYHYKWDTIHKIWSSIGGFSFQMVAGPTYKSFLAEMQRLGIEHQAHPETYMPNGPDESCFLDECVNSCHENNLGPPCEDQYCE